MGPETMKGPFWIVSCFFVFGCLQVFFREVIALASLDAFAESSVAMKQAMVVSGMSPVMVKLVVPWVSWKVLPYSGKLTLPFVLYTAAFVITTVASSPASRYVGVISLDVGSAMAESTFLSLGAFYGDVAVISFAAGGGLGTVLGAVYYSGISTWTCVPPRIAVSFLIPSTFFFVITFVVLDKSYVDQRSENNSTSFPDVHYDTFGDQKKRASQLSTMTVKVRTLLHLFMPITYLFMQYFADHLSIQTIIPTLASTGEAHDLRIGHYTYYSLAHDIGSLIGRSYLLLLAITCPCVASHAQIKHMWILATGGNIMMFCLVFLSWFHPIIEVEVILVSCFIIGLIAGSHYANSPLVITEQVRNVTEGEFALGILTLGSSAGMYAAGLLGLFLKPYLTQHCLFVLGKNCPKKFFSFKGWIENAHCR